jgi:hypothetical protein
VAFFVVAAIGRNNNEGERTTVLFADAMAPPYPELVEESRKHRQLYESLHPNTTYFSLPVLPSGIWEPASDFKKRRRLHNRGLTEPADDEYGRDDEICRYLDDDECETIQAQFVQMGVKARSRIVRMSHTVSHESEIEPYTLRTLVVLVAWTDQQDRRDWISRDQIDRMWNGVGTDDSIPTGSIKNYTERQAYGTVNFVADVLDWEVTDNTEAYYADKRSALPQNGDRDPHLREAFHYILDKMDAENFPWGDYDSDDDGIIDHIQFVHSGYGAEIGGIGKESILGDAWIDQL